MSASLAAEPSPVLHRTPTDEDWEQALHELSHTELPRPNASMDGGSATEGCRCAPCSTCWQRLNAAPKSLKRQVLVLYYASLDPAVGVLPKAIVWIALTYALSPLDLIPDFIPFLGTSKPMLPSHSGPKPKGLAKARTADRVPVTPRLQREIVAFQPPAPLPPQVFSTTSSCCLRCFGLPLCSSQSQFWTQHASVPRPSPCTSSATWRPPPYFCLCGSPALRRRPPS